MFENSLFMYHTQCSMQYVPSLIPTTRLTQPLRPPPLQNPQFVSQSPQSLMVHLPLRFLTTHFSLTSNVLRVIPCSISKWNHMIIESVCLAYFTQLNLFQSRPCWYKSLVFSVYFLIFILLAVIWASWVCGLVSIINFGNSWSLLLHIFLQLFFLFFSFLFPLCIYYTFYNCLKLLDILLFHLFFSLHFSFGSFY